MPKIYTKTGDTGQCSLGNGSRVFKNDPLVEALGAVDELSAVLGVARSLGLGKEINKWLLAIQEDLLAAGAVLSGYRAVIKRDLAKRVDWLEKEIDLIARDLPGLNHFVLAGGNKWSAWLHLGRTVCRRVERRVVAVGQGEGKGGTNKNVGKQVLIAYFNRLGDFLFTLARRIEN